MKYFLQKTIIVLLLTSIICLLNSLPSYAQCGDRYLEKIYDRDQVSITTDITFGSNINASGEEQSLELDFYEPTVDDLEKRPLIIWAFGGAFVIGIKDSPDIVELCHQFSQRGYVNASIEYRIYPLVLGTPTDEQIQEVAINAVGDMKAAIRFFYKHAEEYGIDTNRIFVGGVSAGAIVAIHTAYVDEDDDLPESIQSVLDANGGIEGNSGNPGYSTKIQGVISLAGAILEPEWMEEGDVPIVSVQGDADEIVPYETGLANGIIEMSGGAVIHQHASEIGVPNALHTISGGNHVSPVFAGSFLDIINSDLNTTIIDSISAPFVSEFLYQYSCPVSTNDVVKQPISIQIYPNPAKDQFFVDWSDTQFVGNSLVQIFNNAGQCIYHQESQQQGVHIQRNNWPSGLYHLKITNSTKTVHKKVLLD